MKMKIFKVVMPKNEQVLVQIKDQEPVYISFPYDVETKTKMNQNQYDSGRVFEKIIEGALKAAIRREIEYRDAVMDKNGEYKINKLGTGEFRMLTRPYYIFTEEK